MDKFNPEAFINRSKCQEKINQKLTDQSKKCFVCKNSNWLMFARLLVADAPIERQSVMCECMTFQMT